MKTRDIVTILTLSAAAPAPGHGQTACDITWKDAVAVSSDSSVATLPRLSVCGDTIHLVWFGIDTTALGTLAQSGLRYSRSTDGGATFSGPLKLLSPFESLPGHLAADGDRVYIVSGAILDTFFGIALFTSTDGGALWSAPARVLAGAFPELLFVSEGNVYIGYREIESSAFGLLRSTDGGATWVTLGRRIRELSDVAVSGRRFHAVGPAPGASQTEAAYYTSTDSGQTWFGPSIISPEDLVRSAYPSVSLNDRGHIFSAWIDTGAVITRLSRNGGVSWGSWQRLSGEPGSVTAEIGSAGEFVMVVWGREIGGVRGIRARMSNDRGESFCPAVLPAGGDFASEPVLQVTDSTAHVAWIDETDGAGGVYYRRGVMPANPEGEETLPSAFALRQSYPNPTNGFAYIGFDVPVQAAVVIGIYNVLGELVARPAGETYAPGRYVEPVDVGALPSGVYFYRLTAPGFDGFGKMVVLR